MGTVMPQAMKQLYYYKLKHGVILKGFPRWTVWVSKLFRDKFPYGAEIIGYTPTGPFGSMPMPYSPSRTFVYLGEGQEPKMSVQYD
jgi:hypothetical protein